LTGPAVEADELVEPAMGPRQRSLALGNAVHAALEWSARRAWAEPSDADLHLIMAREGLQADSEALQRLASLLEGWKGSKMRKELAACDEVKPEAPFVLGLAGTVVRGKIDLLAESSAGPLVVDYKTDALRGTEPEQLAERYATQRDLYALAAGARRPDDAATEQVRTAHCFLEAPDRPVINTYDAAELDSARRRLEGLIEGITAGDFRRTDNPHASLCFGCPAAARLCGNPAWRPSWAGPGAARPTNTRGA
jgi:hypothetical protein